jgi:hypothetical protein
MSLSTIGVSGSGANGLTRVGMLALPVATTTAGWVIAVDSDLHLLIARPTTHETLHFRLVSSTRVQSLPALPMVLAGAATAGGELVVTGSDRAGVALTVGVARSGAEAWRVELAGATPIRWPIPFGGLRPLIVWQTEPHWLDSADIATGVLEVRDRLPVGGPPLAVGACDGALWSAWADKSRISGVQVSDAGTAAIQIAGEAADTIAIGAESRRAWIAWTRASSSFLARFERERASSDITPIDLAAAAGGNLTLVLGRVPVVWSQRGQAVEGEPMRHVSALAIAGRRPIEIEGLVYSVAWWGDTLAVMGSDELWLFQMA